MRKSALFIAMLAIHASSAHAKDTEIVLDPISQWNIDYADSSCSLLRKFGTPDKPLLLRMSRYGASGPLEIAIAGGATEAMTWDQPTSITFVDNEPINVLTPTVLSNPAYGKGAVFTSRLPRDGAHVKRIAIKSGRSRLALNTGTLGPALEAMAQCGDALLEKWGLDPKTQKTLSQQAQIIDPKAMLSAANRAYPAKMIASDTPGRLNLVLLVSATGEVSDCRIGLSYSDPSFSEVTCAAARNARFKPALDASGNPVGSLFSTVMFFRTK